jgi:hypothetical protein
MIEWQERGGGGRDWRWCGGNGCYVSNDWEQREGSRWPGIPTTGAQRSGLVRCWAREKQKVGTHPVLGSWCRYMQYLGSRDRQVEGGT